MIYEEAINSIKEKCGEAQKFCGCELNGVECADCHYHIAIEALEKQIPKKPDVRSVMHKEYEPEVFGQAYRWCCPTCGNVVEVDDNEYYKTELYPACECGQRIDWSIDWADDELDEYHMKWKSYEVE